MTAGRGRRAATTTCASSAVARGTTRPVRAAARPGPSLSPDGGDDLVGFRVFADIVPADGSFGALKAG